MDYSGYQQREELQDLAKTVDIRDGVALLTMNRPEVFNATGFTLHNELGLGRIWPDLGRDPEVRVAVMAETRPALPPRPGPARRATPSPLAGTST